MKYNVEINEKKRTITVTLADGTIGIAQCNPTDKFDVNTGIELALERAKVAQAEKNKPKPTKSVFLMMKELSEALPKGEVVVVGHGDHMTEAQRDKVLALIGETRAKCCCGCYTEDDMEEAKEEAYHEGYEDGYADGGNDADDADEAYEDGYAEGKNDLAEAIRERVSDILDEILDI